MDIRFLRSFLANPLRMGSAFPSSPALAGQITDPINFARARVIVELGPGTGAFTRLLAQRAHPACRVLALELDTELAAYVATRYPRVEVINAAAQRLPEVLAERGISQVDAVVCGLPFANFGAVHQARSSTPCTRHCDRVGRLCPTASCMHRCCRPVVVSGAACRSFSAVWTFIRYC